MRIQWLYDDGDLARLRAFVARYTRHPFVERRRARNVARTEILDLSRRQVWWAHLGCLLTTQQRSGADSPVNRLLDEEPFPLSLDRCLAAPSVRELVQSQLEEAGGIRFPPKIAVMADANLAWLQGGGWTMLDKQIVALGQPTSIERERGVARWVDLSLKGFGPKQSRNFLQWLGLTRFEIPLDSRVVRWANDFGFPVHLSAAGLADEAYYEFVLDGLQMMCNALDVLPCELDAMIFIQSEPPDWTGGRAG